MAITGNTFTIPPGATAISLSGVQGPSVTDNTIASLGGNTSGIIVGQMTQNGVVANNAFAGVSSPLQSVGAKAVRMAP